jgi:hypothetical protein
MRLAPLLAVLTLLVGCGKDFSTTYGTTDPAQKSVNGVVLLRHACAQVWQLRASWMLSPRLEDDGLGCLIHVMSDPGLPDASAVAWLYDWLDAVPGRQAVIVLRDGNIAPWLCTRWAGQARSEAKRVGPPEDQTLITLAERLERRAISEAEPTAVAAELGFLAAPAHDDPDEDLSAEIDDPTAMLDLIPRASTPVARISGLGLTAVPPTLTIGAAPSRTGLAPLVTVDPRGGGMAVPLISAEDIGESRLILVANATGLVDGAQADPAARALLAALVGEINEYAHDHQAPTGAAWVGRLAVRHGEEEQVDMLSLLFATPPISYVAWHLIAALAVFLLWRGRFLGRREAPPPVDRQRFISHVAALAEQLAHGRHARAAAAEIAAWRGLPPPSQSNSPTDHMHRLDAQLGKTKDHR